jgi:adenosylmethionine-8-amino-7-oxononanoate aminotransferase
MNYQQIDKDHIWHPYTQAKSAAENIVIVKGYGAYLYDESGKKYLDATASWWTNTHGHAHPYLSEKVYKQATTVEHVIFAGYTHPAALKLVEKLKPLLPQNQARFFFSDNGSTAVEVALKMSFQYWKNKGENRKLIVAFDDAYHGDTFGSMAVSARGLFTDPFKPFLFDVMFVPVPSTEADLRKIEQLIAPQLKQIAAFIYEPLVQGAGGMKMYDSTLFDILLAQLKEQEIILIADEVMTGFGRTGKLFASDYMNTKPDVMCFSKGLTAGMLPMSLTTATRKMYDAFFSDDKTKTFFHGHSFTANPIGCAAALASLELFDIENTIAKIQQIEQSHLSFKSILEEKSAVKEVAVLGTILRFELRTDTQTGYLNDVKTMMIPFFQERGIMIRPLGNIIYFLPPYCVSKEDLDYLYATTLEFISFFVEKQ